MAQLVLWMLIGAIVATLAFNLTFALFPHLAARGERWFGACVARGDRRESLTLPRLFPLQTTLSGLLVLFILLNLAAIMIG